MEAATANRPDPDTQADPDPVVGTVLCIEDDPINLAVIAGLLGNFPGVTLIQAPSGRDGVRIAREQRPDLVLLDMNLPDISGLEVVRMLSEEISQRRLAVILLTGDSYSIDIVKALSLGAREYWLKPIDLPRLRDGLARALKHLLAERARGR